MVGAPLPFPAHSAGTKKEPLPPVRDEALPEIAALIEGKTEVYRREIGLKSHPKPLCAWEDLPRNLLRGE